MLIQSRDDFSFSQEIEKITKKRPNVPSTRYEGTEEEEDVVVEETIIKRVYRKRGGTRRFRESDIF